MGLFDDDYDSQPHNRPTGRREANFYTYGGNNPETCAWVIATGLVGLTAGLIGGPRAADTANYAMGGIARAVHATESPAASALRAKAQEEIALAKRLDEAASQRPSIGATASADGWSL